MAHDARPRVVGVVRRAVDRKSTRLNSSHVRISYAVFCLKKKNRARRSGHDSPHSGCDRTSRQEASVPKGDYMATKVSAGSTGPDLVNLLETTLSHTYDQY